LLGGHVFKTRFRLLNQDRFDAISVAVRSDGAAILLLQITEQHFQLVRAGKLLQGHRVGIFAQDGFGHQLQVFGVGTTVVFQFRIADIPGHQTEVRTFVRTRQQQRPAPGRIKMHRRSDHQHAQSRKQNPDPHFQLVMSLRSNMVTASASVPKM
jgi:hypothetical protein